MFLRYALHMYYGTIIIIIIIIMMMPSTIILMIGISMVLKRNRGLSLDIGSERAEHKTHNSNHRSQKLDAIGFSVFKIGMKSTVI